jgi:hypothetical protein
MMGVQERSCCAIKICRYPGFVRDLSAHKSSDNRTNAQPRVQFKSFGSVDHAIIESKPHQPREGACLARVLASVAGLLLHFSHIPARFIGLR